MMSPREGHGYHVRPCGGSYVSAQFLALMAANSHFLALLAKQGNWWNAAYFTFILGSLFCLGGVLESRREFLRLEAVRMAGMAAAVLGAGVWFGGVREPFAILGIATFALGSLAALWLATRKRVAECQREGGGVRVDTEAREGEESELCSD